MNTTRTTLVLAIVAASALAVAGCGDAADQSSGAAGGQTTTIPTRAADEPVIESDPETGVCDPERIDIDHERNTPYIAYNGIPGDQVHISYVSRKSDDVIGDFSFSLEDGQDGHKVVSDIYNGDLKEIRVSADGEAGAHTECIIPIA